MPVVGSSFEPGRTPDFPAVLRLIKRIRSRGTASLCCRIVRPMLSLGEAFVLLGALETDQCRRVANA